MNAIVKLPADSEISTDNSIGLLAKLITAYEADKKKIINFNNFMNSDAFKGALYYFMATSKSDGWAGNRMSLNSVGVALAHLDAEYWNKALHATDVYEYMPQDRKKEWKENIEALSIPAFEANTVYDTMLDLLSKRPYFQAERVDGVFKNLSGDHVTNTPEWTGLPRL
jgi:hypothetical protein